MFMIMVMVLFYLKKIKTLYNHNLRLESNTQNRFVFITNKSAIGHGTLLIHLTVTSASVNLKNVVQSPTLSAETEYTHRKNKLDIALYDIRLLIERITNFAINVSSMN